MARVFAYLVAVLDLYSRKVLAFRMSNAMSSDFCIEAMEEALARFGPPEIFNTRAANSYRTPNELYFGIDTTRKAA